MYTRLLLAAGVTLTLAACNDSSPTSKLSPTGPAREITCRSGYHIATREDGSEECVPDGDEASSFAAPSTGSGTPPASPAAPAAQLPPVAAPAANAPPVATPAAATPIAP
jgi:hypothetical protein